MALALAPMLAVLPAAAGLPQMAARAETLRIGVAEAPGTLDPFASDRVADANGWRLLYEGLTRLGPDGDPQPALAASWEWQGSGELQGSGEPQGPGERQDPGESREPGRWVFHLRPGAEFHDGTPVTAALVLRALAGLVRDDVNGAARLVRMEAPAPDRLVLVAEADQRDVPSLMAALPVLGTVRAGGTGGSGGAGMAEAGADGAWPAGTGPFVLTGGTPGDGLRFRRAASQAGPEMPWQGVQLRPFGDARSRVQALREGEVDLIEQVPPGAATALAGEPGFAVATAPADRRIVLRLGVGPAATPWIEGPDGHPLANPLQDSRVRRALDIAIDRAALADRVLDGHALAAPGTAAGETGGDDAPDGVRPGVDLPGTDAPEGQLAGGAADGGEAPEGGPGELARHLLQQAGLPDGFRAVLHLPPRGVAGGQAVAQAIAQMWGAIGLTVVVEPHPAPAGGMDTRPDAPAPVIELLDLPAAALGNDAGTDAAGGHVLLPLLVPMHIWASRSGIAYTPRLDGITDPRDAQRD